METDENEINVNIFENDLNGSKRSENQINNRILENVCTASEKGRKEICTRILENISNASDEVENEINNRNMENVCNASEEGKKETCTRILENVSNASQEGENETNASILGCADESENKLILTEVEEVNYNEKTEDSRNVTFSASQENNDFDFLDPGTWPTQISDSQRCFIIRMRTGREEEPDLSQSMRDSRSLTKEWFFKKLPNGNKIKRSWLVYSSSKNALFCLPCRLFLQTVSNCEANLSSLVKEDGFRNWKKLNEKIPSHENSQNHKLCFCSWKTLETSLGIGGIDKEMQEQIIKEENNWRDVLRCIIDAILYLAKEASPLRGSEGKEKHIGDPRSGKFLNTIELISHYKSSLREHIERHKKGQISYFSPKIQDEILEVIAGKVRGEILKEVIEAKYFSLIFDCTPDISRNEQMTQIIRYVTVDEKGPKINECFIDFFIVKDKTGLGLMDEILQKLESDGLNINNCRGQSYDNGANMAGIYKGVQSRILNKNELAYFVPCAAHSLNLVGTHAAEVSIEAQNFFGAIHSVYSFFSASSARWDILKQFLPITLKSQSKTRWSAKAKAVEVVFKHFDKINMALDEFANNSLSIPEVKIEAMSVKKHINNYEFIAFLCFWNRVLKKIDNINKILQKQDLTVDISVKHIYGLLNFFKSTRENIVLEAISQAQTMAEDNNLPANFKDVRKRKKKKMFDEDCEDEITKFSREDLFRKSLLEIVDRIVKELNTRFQALENINTKFSFINGEEIEKSNINDIKEKAKELAIIYREDLNVEEFAEEIESFKFHAMAVDKNFKTAKTGEILKLIYQNKLEEIYPNLTILLKIFLTLPVSVASGERSFSKLKQIKTYLRSTMGQQRLSNLSIIAIEHERASTIDYNEIINVFAAKKARKVKF